MAQKSRYEAIINMPHHVSKTHPQMSMADRAMQFGSFSPLVGYEEAIATMSSEQLAMDIENALGDEQ